MHRRSSWLYRQCILGTVILCSSLVFGVLPSRADLDATITVETTYNPPEGFQYQYLIDNLPQSTVTINAFVLDVGTDADLQNIEGPTGWLGDYDPAEDPFEMVWVPTGTQYEIPIGGQGAFRFTSQLAPELFSYYIANLAPDGSELGSVWGDIGAPGRLIPEPAACSLLLLALGVIIFMRRQCHLN